MNRRHAKQSLRKALGKLRPFLNSEYCSGQIHYEGDVVMLTAQYLRILSRKFPGWWCFGTQHRFLKLSPDITCYHSPLTQMPDDFRINKEINPAYLICAFEVKFADWGKDLSKLSELQEMIECEYGYRPLAWMIYGDHFNRAVHERNYLRQVERENQILQWFHEDEDNRGVTILKCGVHIETEDQVSFETRESLNRTSWTLNAKSKYKN